MTRTFWAMSRDCDYAFRFQTQSDRDSVIYATENRKYGYMPVTRRTVDECLDVNSCEPTVCSVDGAFYPVLVYYIEE